jgi:hypothetical protein
VSRKSITFALATVATLGAIALSSSAAFAAHPGGGGYHFANRTPNVSKGPMVTGIKIKPGNPIVTGIKIKPGMVTGIKIPPKVVGIKIDPNFNHHHHAHWPRWWWWRYSWQRPYWVAPVVAGGVATYATTPTTNRCTCLTKEYTPQGAVVFKDVCTNEMAMNPPANVSPAAYMPQPQQQGYLQPQSQPQVQ